MSKEFIGKEEVKNKIIQQFMNPESDIHYLMSSMYEPKKYFSKGTFTISEFGMTVLITRIDDTNKFQLSFEEFDEDEFKAIAGKHQDLSKDFTSEISVHSFERIKVTDIGLQFHCVEYALRQDDYNFKLYLFTLNDWTALEYDPVNRVLTGCRHSDYPELLYDCEQIRRDFKTVYHELEYKDELLEKIRQSKWIDKMEAKDRDFLLYLFSKKGTPKNKWYLKGIMEQLLHARDPLTGKFNEYKLNRKTIHECIDLTD